MKPFEKLTALDLWTDPYISNKMLEHHLSFDDNIASRKYETIEKTVKFLEKKLLNEKESVLDLGCGPGLYTDLFERSGYSVTGIDVSSNSIDYAKSNNSNVMYKVNNYVDMEPEGCFDLITMIYCDFSVLDFKQRNKLLHNVRAMLNNDGHFAFDVHSMNLLRNFDTGIHRSKEVDGFYMTGSCDIMVKNKVYTDEAVCLTHIKAVGERDLEFYNWYQCYTTDSITELLHSQGFKIVDIYSNSVGDREFDKSDSLFVIARLQNETR